MSDQNKKDKLKRMAMALGVPEEDIRREDFRESEILSSTLRMNYKDPQVTIRPDEINLTTHASDYLRMPCISILAMIATRNG